MRHVRTPAGRRRFKQPIGAAIVPDAQLELPDMPETPDLLPRDANRLKVRDAAQLRKDSYYKARDAQALLDTWIESNYGDGFDDGTGNDHHSVVGVEETLHTFGLYPEDAYGDNAFTIAGVVAETQWGMFGACREIREAAYDLLGYDAHGDAGADHNLHGPVPEWGGGMTGAAHPHTYAYAMMDELNRAPKQDFPLYRGIALNSEVDDYVKTLRADDTFDMPLGSFTDFRWSAERFTGGEAVAGGAIWGREVDEEDASRPRVLFVLQKGARAIQGGSMGTPDEVMDPDSPLYDEYFDETEQNHEYISGGRFKVMSVHTGKPYHTGNWTTGPRTWGQTTLIYIKQVATFDPLDGVAHKALDFTGKRCPFASVWDEPYIKREPKQTKGLTVTEKKVRRVRTAAGVKFFGLPIGSVIGFTGTRSGMTKEQRSKVAQIVKGVAPKMTHHGDAVGADTDFHKVARRLKVPIHRHPSNLPAAVRGDNKDADVTSKPKPPLERNKDIVARSAVIIATPSSDKEERRSGTWATVRAARKSKTPVIIVFPDGTVKREGFAPPSPKPISTPPAPAPAPTAPAPRTSAPLPAGTNVDLRTNQKPSPNFPKGKYTKVVTPSGEWYHVGNFGTDKRPNWRVYRNDDYSRKGIVSTRNKTRLDAMQWIRDKHANDVVRRITQKRTLWTPEDDKRYQHNYKMPKSAIADITAIHDGTKFRDILPWRVDGDTLITDSYDGYLDVLHRIGRRRARHQKRADDLKLSHNQRTHERAVVRALDKVRDDLHGLHNTGLLVHAKDDLNEQRAWSRAIALIHEDAVLDRMSPLARWSRGGEISVRGQYTKRQVIANLRALMKRREKAGLDNTGAEELYNWLRNERVKPTIVKIPVQHIPRTHEWRRPPDLLHRVPGGTPTSYQGDEIWISDVTYDDPKNPGKVINLKFIKTKHPDGTYSIQYPDGTIKPYPDQRSANVASLEWLRDNTPPVPMSAKGLLAGILFDIQTALVETKVVRNVIDSDYWGLPVGTPLTGHEYQPHPRERVGRLIPKHGSRQSGASTPVITKQPSKYEDYDLYTDASGREFNVGEIEDGFWVATRGDEMDVWPASGMSQAEVLRELRKYVERTAPVVAPAPAPAKKTTRKLTPKAPVKKVAKKAPVKKAAKKAVKPRKTAKKAPARKAPAKSPVARTAPARPTPHKAPAVKPRKSGSKVPAGTIVGHNAKGDPQYMGPNGKRYTKFTAHNQDGKRGMHLFNEKKDAAALKERGLAGQTGGNRPWIELWIADDLDQGGISWDGGHSGVYAVGIDADGRRQSRQLKARAAQAQLDKWPRIDELITLLPTLDKALKRDRGDDTADCLLLIRKTGMRPSSEKDTGSTIENYGATTFQVKHVTKVKGGYLRIQMDSAKKGHTDLLITDKDLVAVILNHMQGKKPGDQVFSETDEIELRDYMKSNLPRFSGDNKFFQVKDLRTAIGTIIALQEIADKDAQVGHEIPATQTEFRAWMKDVCEVVSAQLCNKPNQAAKSYINPAVWDMWLALGTVEWIPKAYRSEAL